MKKNKIIRCFLLITLVSIIPLLGACKKNNQDIASEIPSPTPTEALNEEPDKGKEKYANDWFDAYPIQMGKVNITTEDIFKEDFESGQTNLNGRGSATVDIVNTHANEGVSSLYVTERAAPWNGAEVNITDLLDANCTYVISAYVFYEEGPDSVQIDCKIERNGNQYLDFASSSAKKGQWTHITGSIIIAEDTETATLYFETDYKSEDLIDFYIDDISITKETSMAERGDIPALKDVYKNHFTVGVAATVNEISPDRQELIRHQFNTLTPGNELKADAVLDYNTCKSDPKYDDNPAISFSAVEPLLDFAKKNNMKVRGHTLIWHSQTPRWFFAENYSKADDAPLVSRELMLKRMENYIKNVFDYVNDNYPDLFYAWDVVNEAINPSEANTDTNPQGFRIEESYYYQVVGPDFIEKSFEFARKYANENIKLFYNDYNTEDSSKRSYIYDLIKDLSIKGLIDGVGLQSHLSVDSPSLLDVESSIRKYAELDLEIHLTEIDMGTNKNTEEEYLKQASRYKRLFTFLINFVENGTADITNVTFWGLSDDISWLNKPGQPSYPLLFDRHLIQKPAFWGVLLHPDITLY